MRYHERQRLFREHAAARLRRDTAETARIEATIGPDLTGPHRLFVFALFAAAVSGHFGDELDSAELADFVAGARRAEPGPHWLRAEALIRLCYGEIGPDADAPPDEEPAPMWAVLARLVPPEASDAALAALFGRADEVGRRIVSRVFERERLYGWADEPETEPGLGSGPGCGSDAEPVLRSEPESDRTSAPPPTESDGGPAGTSSEQRSPS